MTFALALLFLAPPPEGLAQTLRSIRRETARSVVAIHVTRLSDPDGTSGPGSAASHRDYYNRAKGPASGVIYESDGIIITSWFNVSGEIAKDGLHVTLPDGRKLPAKLRGYDEERDIALIKVDAKDLPALKKADPKLLGQGTLVALVGRAPDPLIPTINFGILSAMSRMDGAAVQTDAEMNYGNTGGALVTLKGELVGVACNINPNTAWGQSGGVGFACKTTEIDSVLEKLKRGEKIEAKARPYLGIRPGEGNPDVVGLQVTEVLPSTPAARAGLKAMDVITEFGGVKIVDSQSLSDAIKKRSIGEEVELKIKRKTIKGDYEEKTLKVKIGEKKGA